MNTVPLTLADVLTGNLSESRTGEALYVLREFVREEVKKETADHVQAMCPKRWPRR